MKIAEKRALFFDEIEDSIKELVKQTVDKIAGRRSTDPGDDQASIAALGGCLKSDEVTHAFERVLYDALENLAYSFMLTLDRNTPLAGKFEIALLDWDAKENLAPRNDTYAAQFLEHIYGEEC